MKKKAWEHFKLKARNCMGVKAGEMHSLTIGGIERALAYVHADGGGVNMAYCINGKNVVSTVRFLWTIPFYGGRRLWLQCPSCGTRRGVLYFTAAGMICADCMGGVLYHCQLDDRGGALLSRWRARLGPDEERPRYMHRSTYIKLMERIDDRINMKMFYFIGGWKGLRKFIQEGEL